ncbi:hypothetical protein [Flavobacterium sp.]|uniref:hypothetical protein n=1 Tax=Flavobacterium sp. TaxID=239 RepID=UPI003D6A396E
MFNITLIFTIHKECGNCNSTELHKIIEKICPEIIFEELSYSCFDECYKKESLITLETTAIKKYLQNHNIEHIPVDTYPIPKSFHNDIDYMYNKIFNNHKIIECHSLRVLIDNQSSLISKEGFSNLNSNQNDKYFKKVSILKKRILDILNNEKLFYITNLSFVIE